MYKLSCNIYDTWMQIFGTLEQCSIIMIMHAIAVWQYNCNVAIMGNFVEFGMAEHSYSVIQYTPIETLSC